MRYLLKAGFEGSHLVDIYGKSISKCTSRGIEPSSGTNTDEHVDDEKTVSAWNKKHA